MIKVNGLTGNVELSGDIATVVAEFGVGLKILLDEAAKDSPIAFRRAVKLSADMVAYVLADAQTDNGIKVDLGKPAKEKKSETRHLLRRNQKGG